MEHPENIKTLLDEIIKASNDNESFEVLKMILDVTERSLKYDIESLKCISILEGSSKVDCFDKFKELSNKAYNIYHYSESTYPDEFGIAYKASQLNGVKLFIKQWLEAEDSHFDKLRFIGSIYESLSSLGYLKDSSYENFYTHHDLIDFGLNEIIILDTLYKAKVFDFTTSATKSLMRVSRISRNRIISAIEDIHKGKTELSFDPDGIYKNFKALDGTAFKISDLGLCDKDFKFITKIIETIDNLNLAIPVD